MAKPTISIEELEKAIIAIQRGEEPQVDLPPEVVHAIRAAMSQLGNFSPTPEFLQKLQQSLEARLRAQNPEVTITLPVKYLKRGGASLAALVFVGAIWAFYGDTLALPQPDPAARQNTLQSETRQPEEVMAGSQPPEANTELVSDETATALADLEADTAPADEPEATTIPIAAESTTTPTPTPTPQAATTSPNRYSYLVRMAPEAYAEIRDSIFPIRVTEYLPEEYWIELRPDEAAKLDSSLDFTPVKDPFQLFQRPGFSDPLGGLPPVDTELTQATAAGEAAVYLLQYVAQTKGEWSGEVEALGADIIGDDNDYRRVLVWATPEVSEELEGVDFVRWVGPFHPQYKVQEKLLSTTVPAFAVKGIFYAADAAMLEQVKLAILDEGGIITSSDEAISAGNRVTLDLVITPDIVRDIISIPQAISVYAEKSREFK